MLPRLMGKGNEDCYVSGKQLCYRIWLGRYAFPSTLAGHLRVDHHYLFAASPVKTESTEKPKEEFFFRKTPASLSPVSSDAGIRLMFHPAFAKSGAVLHFPALLHKAGT